MPTTHSWLSVLKHLLINKRRAMLLFKTCCNLLNATEPLFILVQHVSVLHYTRASGNLHWSAIIDFKNVLLVLSYILSTGTSYNKPLSVVYRKRLFKSREIHLYLYLYQRQFLRNDKPTHWESVNESDLSCLSPSFSHGPNFPWLVFTN